MLKPVTGEGSDSQLYKSVLDQIAMVAGLDGEKRICMANDRLAELTGLPMEDLLGQEYFILAQAFQNDVFTQDVWDTLERGEVWRGHWHIEQASGRQRWIAATIVPIRPGEYRQLKYFFIGLDATESIAAGIGSLETADVLNLLQSVAQVGSWRLDLLTGELEWSEVTKQIHQVPLDYSPKLEEAIDFYAPEARPIIEGYVTRGMETGEGWDTELPLITRNGDRIWVRAIGRVTIEGGVPIALYGTFQDISAHKNTIDSLSEETLRLKDDGRHSYRLIADMSRQLRSPITQMLGHARRMLSQDNSPLQEWQQESLKMIESEGRKCQNAVNELLEFIELESGQRSQKVEDFLLNSLLSDIRIQLNSILLQSQMAFHCEVDETLVMNTDRNTLRRIVCILVTEAVSRCQPHAGRYLFTTKVLVDPEESEPEIRFIFSDDALPLSAERVHRLNRILQSEEGVAVEPEDIRYALLKRLVSSLDGRISVSMAAGSQTSFVLELPGTQTLKHHLP